MLSRRTASRSCASARAACTATSPRPRGTRRATRTARAGPGVAPGQPARWRLVSAARRVDVLRAPPAPLAGRAAARGAGHAREPVRLRGLHRPVPPRRPAGARARATSSSARCVGTVTPDAALGARAAPRGDRVDARRAGSPPCCSRTSRRTPVTVDRARRASRSRASARAASRSTSAARSTSRSCACAASCPRVAADPDAPPLWRRVERDPRRSPGPSPALRYALEQPPDAVVRRERRTRLVSLVGPAARRRPAGRAARDDRLDPDRRFGRPARRRPRG